MLSFSNSNSNGYSFNTCKNYLLTKQIFSLYKKLAVLTASFYFLNIFSSNFNIFQAIEQGIPLLYNCD